MRKIKKIILHCSASSFGTEEIIDSWHRQRGWSGTGYHYVICNGFVKKNVFDENYDGKIQKGRSLNKVGAHCKGENVDSIGICLVGNNSFTIKQLDALLSLLLQLCDDYSIPASKIFGHNEFSSKTCPNFDVELIRKMMRKGMCIEHPDFK